MFVLKSTYNKAKRQLESAGRHYRELKRDLFYKSLSNSELVVENQRLKLALRTILKQETVNPNSTVKRILNIAKTAIGDGGTTV